MDELVLSIITINYNNAAGLQKTIDSVVKQSIKNFEYIVIDGGSADASIEIIKNAAGKIDYWVSEPDRGIYHAMNKGVAKANGKYILFVNSGDMLIEDTILKEIISCLSGEEIIYGDYEVRAPDKTWVKRYPDTLSFTHFIHDSIAHSAAAFIKRTAFAGELSVYDETLKIVSDWKWYLSGIFKYNYAYKHIPKVIGVFDFTGTSATNQALIMKEKAQVFKNDFGNIYKELATSASYKAKYETLNNARLIRLYLKLKNIISRKQ